MDIIGALGDLSHLSNLFSSRGSIELGSGSYGVVRLDGAFARKSPLDGESRAIAHLEREAAALQELAHENIVKMIRFEESPPVLVLEKLDGQDLVDCIIDEKLIDQKKITKQLASAVSYCAQKNFVHADVRIENIRVLTTGDIKLFDFGTASKVHSVFRWDNMYGCCSPERICGLSASSSMDVWGIGVVMVEMRTKSNFYIVDNIELLDSTINGMLFMRSAILAQIAARTLSPFDQSLRTYFHENACVNAKDDHAEMWQNAALLSRSQLSLLHVINGPAQKLLEKIFTLDPRDRISADAILEDPYLT
jgi:serine/threonine protein kinase